MLRKNINKKLKKGRKKMSEKNTNAKSNKSLMFVLIVALLMVFIALIPIGYALFSDYKQDSANAKIG